MSTTTATLKQQFPKTMANSMAEALSEDSRGALPLLNTINLAGLQEEGRPFRSGG